MKTCAKCREVKPLDQFGKNRSAKDGRQTYCKVCCCAEQAAYRAKHPDRVKATAAKSYQANRDQIRAEQAAYRAANRDQIRAQAAARYQTDLAFQEAMKRRVKEWEQANSGWVKERNAAKYREQRHQVQAQHRAYYQANRDQIRAQQAAKYRAEGELARQLRRMAHETRRGRKAAVPNFTVLPKEVRRLYTSPCWACGAAGNIHWDHRVPLAWDGHGSSHGIGNALPLCATCNTSKGAKLLSEWRYRDALLARKAVAA